MANLFHDGDKFDDVNSHIKQSKLFIAHDTYKLGRGMKSRLLLCVREGRGPGGYRGLLGFPPED